MVNNLDLKLIQGLTSFSNTSVGNQNNNVVYAKKGEPMYQKEMDANEDGVITLEEFRDYCKEHDISVKQQQQMLRDRLNYQLNTQRAESSEQISKIESESETIYAKEGDDKYKEEIDSNSDGKITDEERIVVKNEGKAINQYTKTETEEPESKVEKEA